MSKEKGKKKDEAKKLSKKLLDLEELEKLEDLIKDNKVEFTLDGINYRVRKPTPQERRTVNRERNFKYIELLKDDRYMLREQLVEVYKKKDIDINAMEVKLVELQKEKENLLLRLAQTESEIEISKLKEKIVRIKEEQTEISIKKADLLQFSLENSLIEFITTYYCYLLLEKKESDKWTRAFESYDDFLDNCQDKLLTRTVYFTKMLLNYEPI